MLDFLVYMFLVLFFILLIFGICILWYRERKHLNKALKYRQIMLDIVEKLRDLESSPDYILKSAKNNYTEMIGSFDYKVNIFSSEFNFNQNFLCKIDYIEDIIREQNLTKISYQDYALLVRHNDGEYKICKLYFFPPFHSQLKTFYLSDYIHGEWDEDIKLIFTELYKKKLQDEIKDMLKYVISLDYDFANNFYKNN